MSTQAHVRTHAHAHASKATSVTVTHMRTHANAYASRHHSHLLADEDSVSLRDLQEIESGQLLSFIDATSAPWAEHVLLNCLLCQEKVSKSSTLHPTP
jgi:hypothetical protein